jgi:uncharacterized protein (DUF302 family)
VEVVGMTYGRTVIVDGSVDGVLPRVRSALKEQGFGVLTEIDVKATLKEKLGADVEPYVILGACNPGLAHRALQAEPDIGLLLPCNVIVRTHGDRVVVSAMDPGLMSEITENPELPGIAEEATKLLDAALETVERG